MVAVCFLFSRSVAAQEAPPPPSTEIAASPGKGFTVRATDDSFSSTLRARIALRETFAQDPKGFGNNEINIKTLRFYDYGHVLEPSLKYFIQLALGPGDFEKDSASPIYD